MTVGDRSGALALERLASWLRQAPEDSALRPREEFRQDLRERLLTASAAASSVCAASSVSAAPTVRHRAADLGPAGDPLRDGARSGIPRRARRLGLVIRVGVAGIAATTVVSGVAIAAERALPGDTLYGVKRAAEGVQLQLTGDDTEAGLLHLQFAATRLQEVRRLVQEAGEDAASGRVRGALREMDAETTAGAGLLTRAYLARPALSGSGSGSASASRSESVSRSESASPSPLSRLVAFTRDQERTLTTVLPALPAPAAASSLAVLRQVQTRTTALLASPTPGALLPAVQPFPTLPAAPSGRPTWMPGQPTPVASTPRAATPPSTSSSAPRTAPVTATATGRPGSAPAASPTATVEPTPSQAPSTPTSPARPGPTEQATPTAGAAVSPASPAPTSPAPTSPAPTSAGAAPADPPTDSLTGSAAIPETPRVGLPALRLHGPR